MKFAAFASFVVLLVLQCQTNAEPDPEAFVRYSIWISQDVNVPAQKYSLQVPYPQKKSFYQVMEEAAQLDLHYKFEATVHPKYGHFITTIDGVKNNDATSHYWMYGTIQPPDDKFVYASVGVDSFYPETGDHVVFWYKKVDLKSGH